MNYKYTVVNQHKVIVRTNDLTQARLALQTPARGEHRTLRYSSQASLELQVANYSWEKPLAVQIQLLPAKGDHGHYLYSTTLEPNGGVREYYTWVPPASLKLKELTQ